MPGQSLTLPYSHKCTERKVVRKIQLFFMDNFQGQVLENTLAESPISARVFGRRHDRLVGMYSVTVLLTSSEWIRILPSDQARLADQFRCSMESGDERPRH